MLPELSHGKYKSGYKKGLTIIHGAKVEYACDEGRFLNVTEVACYLGVLRPAHPACVVPGQATSIINNRATTPVKRGGNIGEFLSLLPRLEKSSPDLVNSEHIWGHI